MFKKPSLPLQLFIVIAASLIFGSYLSEQAVRFFYTFSVVFKEFLGFFLPFIIFSFIFSGILSFKKNAHIVLGVLLSCIVFSNFVISFTSFAVGKMVLEWLYENGSAHMISTTINIKPLFSFSLPALIGSEKAMLAALVIGIIGSFYSVPWLDRNAKSFKKVVEQILNRFFIPLLPLYVLGFLLKLFYEGVLGALFGSYGRAFALVLLLQAIFLFAWYFIANSFVLSRTIAAIKNAIPCYLTAFSTMSSTAAIPVTIKTMEKNVANKPLVEAAAPILANVHLAGDAVTIPIFSLVTMLLFMGTMPSAILFIKFIFFFCLAMLAVSAVPGGGIIVMIPILKSILGFTPDMISVITALYLIQDSFGTAGNVMGDGAIVIVVNKILKKIKAL